MRILIIGGTIFIGKHVVRRLDERGHDVTLFHRGEHEAPDLPPHLRQRNNYAQDMAVDSSRIRRELGYTDAFTIEDGVRRTFAWTRENPPEKYNPRLLDFSLDDATLAEYRAAAR